MSQRIRHAMGRADQGIGVGREGDGAVDDGLHTRGGQRRDARHGRLDDVLHTIEVGRHQLGAELRRNAIDRPNLRFLLIGAENEAVALLPAIPALLRVADDGELGRACLLPFGNGRHGIGDEVLVQNGHGWHVDAHHGADLEAPGARGIDDVQRAEDAVLRLDQPAAIFAANCQHRIVALDHCAMPLGHSCHRVGGEGGIDVPVIGLIDAAQEAVQSRQRMEFGDAVPVDDFKRVAGELGKARDMAELVHAVRVARDAHRAGAVEAAALAGLLRQDVAVEPHRCGAQFLDGRVVGEMGAQARRMPGGTVGEVILLDQHDIAPARLGEVIEQRAAHGAATDDHHIHVRHEDILFEAGS